MKKISHGAMNDLKTFYFKVPVIGTAEELSKEKMVSDYNQNTLYQYRR